MKSLFPTALLALALLCGRVWAQDDDSVQWPDQATEEGDVLDPEAPAPVDPAYLAAEEPEPAAPAPKKEPQPEPEPEEPTTEVRYRQEQVRAARTVAGRATHLTARPLRAPPRRYSNR